MFKFFNSFFLLIALFLFSTPLVFARTVPMRIELNGPGDNRQTWFDGARNNNLAVFSDYSDNDELVSYPDKDVPNYGYVEFCTNANVTATTTLSPSNLSNVQWFNTEVPCSMGTMHGTIQYVTFNTPLWSCTASANPDLNGRNCQYGYTLQFYQSQQADYYYIEGQFLDEQIRIDMASGAVIGQNNQIINQNQTIINQGAITNSKIDDVNNSINNSNVDDPSSKFDDFESKVASNNVIARLVLLPVTLFQWVLVGVNNVCTTPISLGSLFGSELIIPCINLENYLGSSLFNVIDVLISGLFVYTIGKKMISVFNTLSSLKEGDVLG